MKGNVVKFSRKEMSEMMRTDNEWSGESKQREGTCSFAADCVTDGAERYNLTQSILTKIYPQQCYHSMDIKITNQHIHIIEHQTEFA